MCNNSKNLRCLNVFLVKMSLFKRTVGRVVEGARLEREYGATHRGFESLIVHHT